MPRAIVDAMEHAYPVGNTVEALVDNEWVRAEIVDRRATEGTVEYSVRLFGSGFKGAMIWLAEAYVRPKDT